MTFTLEEPGDATATGKKKRARKAIARVIGKPSMFKDSDEEEEEEEQAVMHPLPKLRS